jgi:hypothetical protein
MMPMFRIRSIGTVRGMFVNYQLAAALGHQPSAFSPSTFRHQPSTIGHQRSAAFSYHR